MVVDLQPPTRPLPMGGRTWTWLPRPATGPWHWCRVYHRGRHNPNGHTPRTFGPVNRLDPHRPDTAGAARTDPDGRSVLYVGGDLATSLAEVFGEVGHAVLCPRWRVAVLAPWSPLRMFDLSWPGVAMAIGALPSLADGPVKRALSQQWARAIYEDQPARQPVTGVRYRSAYNAGVSLAVWDGGGAVTTVPDGSGAPAGVALSNPAMLGRFTVAATARLITVEVIDSVDCRACLADP